MASGPREFEVTLPVGYTDEAGRSHRRAVLRKMRGHEEALLYDPQFKGGRLVTELLRSCLVRLGELESIDADVVARLYTADRNYLLLELRRITLGDRLLTSYLCPRCGSDVTVIEDLSQLEIRRLSQDQPLTEITLELEDGYVDRQGTLHIRLTLTLPRGVDEEFVVPLVEKDPLKAQDVLILRCIQHFGTLPKAALEAYGVKILRDLTLGDRQRLQKAFNEQAPGVNFQRALRCNQCGTPFEGVMDMSNFFFAVG